MVEVSYQLLRKYFANAILILGKLIFLAIKLSQNSDGSYFLFIIAFKDSHRVCYQTFNGMQLLLVIPFGGEKG